MTAKEKLLSRTKENIPLRLLLKDVVQLRKTIERETFIIRKPSIVNGVRG